MALTAAHIDGFVKLFLQKNFDKPVDIPDCHLEWWDMCCTKNKYVAIAAPRGHAKSTAITHSYTLAALCHRERSFILVVSDTEAQSRNFVNDIKRELVENEDLINVYGIQGISKDKDTETDFIVEFHDGHQARVIAKGSEQKLRGLKWRGRRPDLIVCDDLENDEIVMNDDRREKFRNWFTGALIPCKSSDGIIRYVGTILHADSWLERLMPNHRRQKCIETPLCIKNTTREYWYSAKYKAHNQDFSEILWPQQWSKETLQAERAMYVSQGLGEKYAQEFLNVPLDESSAHFRRGDFLAMDDHHKKAEKVYYIGTDLAVTLGQRSDWTVFVVAGVDSDGYLNVEEVIRDRFESPDIVEMILMLNKRYNPQYFFFEKGQITNSVLPAVVAKMMEEDNWGSDETFNSIVDKVQFAQSIKVRIRAKRVRFAKDDDWLPDFEAECLGFPRKGHDDQVDALAILGHGLHKLSTAPTPREKAEEEYADEYADSGLLEAGRNEETGY
jgi:predicted phage terminase large subunit-like protein